MTALGTSRVWVTLGYGILNEVYWPATGQPQTRDLGFIVAGPSGWSEAKRVNRYQISMPEDCVPLPRVTHQGDRYRLVIEVVPDPSRDVVLISYRLTGDDVKLYSLLAPHLANSGEHNNARAAADLTAWKEAAALVELHFSLKQRNGPTFVVKSKDVFDTLDLNHLRKKLVGDRIRRAVFKITFSDDSRGKRVELSGTNKISFNRQTHAGDVFGYLRKWGILA